MENNFLISILQNYGQIPPVLTTYHTTLIYITRSYILPYKQSNLPIIAATTKQIYYQAIKQTKLNHGIFIASNSINNNIKNPGQKKDFNLIIKQNPATRYY